jgi:hypothetical protein
MIAVAISLLVFVCTFTGAQIGIRSRARLPQHHLSDESKQVVQLCMGLIATLTALVLGLITASAKEAYDAQGGALRSVAAGILVLDRTLERFGPEADPVRAQIRVAVTHRLDMNWLEAQSADEHVVAPPEVPTPDQIEDSILDLKPKDDRQRWLQSQALDVTVDVLKTRWLALAAASNSVPVPFLVVIVFWLTALFWSFGLFAPDNRTITAVLLLASASVAASVLLILEMQSPFSGLMRISGAPMQYVLEHLSR